MSEGVLVLSTGGRVVLSFVTLAFTGDPWQVHSAGEGLCLGTSAAAEDKPQASARTGISASWAR